MTMRAIILLFLMLASSPAFAVAPAVTAYFEYRVNNAGWVHQCVYKSIYGRHVINVRSTDLCPITIEV